MPFFEVTYTDGTVEEIEADECQDNGARYLTFVRYRVPFVWTVYTEIVRRAGSPGSRKRCRDDRYRRDRRGLATSPKGGDTFMSRSTSTATSGRRRIAARSWIS
jgi:hypothetical protein